MESILQSIPHRPPFLFIDRILELNADSAAAERLIRAEEPHFAGHYPGNPLMPGVLLCEAVFQTAAVYLVERFQLETGEPGRTPVLARIREAKFKRMVRPGDCLRIECRYTESLGPFHFLKGRVLLDGKPALTLEFALALLEATASDA